MYVRICLLSPFLIDIEGQIVDGCPAVQVVIHTFLRSGQTLSYVCCIIKNEQSGARRLDFVCILHTKSELFAPLCCKL